MAKPALGRGLGALLGGTAAVPKPVAPEQPATSNVSSAPPGERVIRVPLDRIRPSPFQPRKEFAPEALNDLTESIKAQGIIQPLLVRQRGEHYELIAGERRWRAAQLVGLFEAPVIVREADDTAVLELALIENLQRENLNPLEEAQGYAELISRFNLRQEDVAAKVGKSRAWVANALRLLKLPSEVQAFVREGRLSVGHAKVILALEQSVEQRLAAERILKDGLSVRSAEELIAKIQQKQPIVIPDASAGAKKSAPAANAHVQDLENRLRERLGTKVQLKYKNGKGALDIRFFSDDELERLLQILGVRMD
ncbi:MAG TPA: ParB/RepB/Spo0J family partition protein [Verrucomicrobiae bacterium]|nr:ParB/RepB/Spo0J family partition protein [Verrucomicrobiae bacterium]